MDSTYILLNPHTVAESRTTSYIYLLRHPQQNKCADKIYVTGFCTRNPRNFCRWNPLTFWNMFKDLSLESRNIQTQNCAPMQCTIWPRNVVLTFTIIRGACEKEIISLNGILFCWSRGVSFIATSFHFSCLCFSENRIIPLFYKKCFIP